MLFALVACGGGTNRTEPPAEEAGQLRIEVKERGVVHLSFEDLLATGFHGGVLQADALRLSTQGKPAGLRVEAHGKTTLGPGDYVEFFGEGLDTEFTDTAVYWVKHGGGTALPWRTRSVAVSGAPSPVTLLTDTLHLEQNHIAWGKLPGAIEKDHWFWAKLTAPSTGSYPFQLTALSEGAGPSVLRVCLQGGSSGLPNPDHRVRVSLNGVAVGEIAWDDMTEKRQEFELPQGVLVPGENTLTLMLPGDTGAPADVVWFNYFEVDHWRPIEAQGGVAAFSAVGDSVTPFQVKGFPDANIRLLDVTDPLNPISLETPTIAALGGAFSATFLDPSTDTRVYLAASQSQTAKPGPMAVWTSGALRSTSRGADYILIAPRAFLDAANPLCQLRRSQGLRVEPVAVEDIYNEFGDGLPNPQAIKDFLAFAYHSWSRPAPINVLLLGDATYDYRDRMGTGKASRVPVHLTVTSELGWTPDDNWYVDVEGDERPELRIGRLPAADQLDVAELVQKILSYENSPEPVDRRALFVADNNDTSFQEACESFVPLLPAGVSPVKVYLGQYQDFSLARQDIVAAFNQGLVLALYAGHGDRVDWAGEMVFTLSSIPSLTNGDRLPLVVALNCLNGWFASPDTYSLGEALVAASGGGAIGVFAASGYGYTWEQDMVATALLNRLKQGGRPTLGELCTDAKVQAFLGGASTDLLKTYTLLGDPALRLKGIP